MPGDHECSPKGLLGRAAIVRQSVEVERQNHLCVNNTIGTLLGDFYNRPTFRVCDELPDTSAAGHRE